MNIIVFTLALGAGSIAAGFLGALTGLGGGVVIVPMLTLLFGVDIRYAIGASLVSVIATSSGPPRPTCGGLLQHSRRHVPGDRDHVGALVGRVVRDQVPTSGLAIVFGCRTAVFRVPLDASTDRSTEDDGTRPLGHRPSSGLHISNRRRQTGLPRPARARRLRLDVPGRCALGSARHRLGRRERSWRWTRRCGCHSRYRRRRATS